MPFYLTLLIIAGVFGFALMVITLMLRHVKATQAIWSRFAGRHGLQFQPSPWPVALVHVGGVQGLLEGLPFEMRPVNKGSGRNQSTYTRMQVTIPGLPPGLVIRHEGFLGKVGKALGGQDVRLDDPHFDAAFLIKGADPAAVRQYLTLARRDALLLHMREAKGVEVLSGGLVFERRGLIRDEAELDRTIDRLRFLTRALGPGEAAHSRAPF